MQQWWQPGTWLLPQEVNGDDWYESEKINTLFWNICWSLAKDCSSPVWETSNHDWRILFSINYPIFCQYLPNIVQHFLIPTQNPDWKGVWTKCQPDKMPTGQNANLGWHFVRDFFSMVGILSGPTFWLAFCPDHLNMSWHPPWLFGQRHFFSLNNFFQSWPEHG